MTQLESLLTRGRLLLALCLLVGCSSSNLSDGGAAGASSGGAGGGSAGAPEFMSMCTAARAQLLGSVDAVSSGAVSVVSRTDGTTLYVDATAGGMEGAASNPWVYVSLANASRVAVTDPGSVESVAWDLAFKRSLIYTNSGDGGPGQGGSVFLDKAFADVTRADAASADFVSEAFFDADCKPTVELTGSVATSFSSWYEYDEASHVLTPVAGTWLVRGATGALYKLAFSSYYATPSGGMGSNSGAILLKFEAL